MAKKKIIWSRAAKKQLYTIFEADIRKGNDKSFSIDLFKTISKKINLLSKHPEMGVKTSDESIRGLLIESYIVCYEIADDKLVIHLISKSEPNAGSS